MPSHPASIPSEQLLRGCDELRTRRSGPGGQHRNKVESAVVLTHRLTGISAEANERRSQHENRQQAVFRLRVNLALTYRSDRPSGTAVSALWSARCRGGRIQINPGHDDFPALLAETLDVACECGWDLKSAAEYLGCSTSQLVKFLKLEPRAMGQVNLQRGTLGLRQLH